MPRPSVHTLEDLYARTELNEETGCLEWQGSTTRTKAGYGHVQWNGKIQGAHRVAYMLAHDVILASDEHVCHSCDNPPCINVDHLFLGDPQINARDREAKGRGVVPRLRGEQHPNAKLTEEQVRDIRELDRAGVDRREIAQKFNVAVTTIYGVADNENWSWLD